ncbi:hypothetical protein R6Q59_003590 [Mikania micrantha]|uniref:SCP domain-containing protein n=1 Tax=Mikania micrantha TaxID=192012 RepID=A0A5N6MLH0_9ASTR|nr:hypothetical protein E3N88_30181 [Mikania micrantha]
MKKVFLALTIIYWLRSNAVLWRAAAQPPPAVVIPPDGQEYLDAHNRARAEVGVGPLKWNFQLAKATSLLVRFQRDRENCRFANLTSGKYGGNQMWATGEVVTPRKVVENWVAEKIYYTHDNNSCAPDHRCGVYTQVVWRNSAELGCALANCLPDQSTLAICFYNPPGNVIGESPY